MKKFFSFLKKYYGSLIGAAVGFLLSAFYYYLIMQEFTPRISQLVGITEHLMPSIETINSIIASIMGAATFLFWIFLAVGTLLIIFIHVLVTVVIYSLLGLCIHYLLHRLMGHSPVIDKTTSL